MTRTTLSLGSLAAALFVVGPLIAYLGLAPPMVGFGLFALALLCALVGAITGVVALVRGPAGERSAAVRGLAACLVVLVGVALAAAPGAGHPRINDITTDTGSPPAFRYAGALPENAGRDLDYPGEEFARQQREGYPELAPLRLPVPPDEAFAHVLATARRTEGWTITQERPADRALEGYDTSRVFRFRDDFVIEVRPSEGGSVVQMRSKSRDGRGDLGVNAARIRSFFAAVGGV